MAVPERALDGIGVVSDTQDEVGQTLSGEVADQ
jgi:hypothetical protein